MHSEVTKRGVTNPPLFFRQTLLWLLGLMFCIAASLSSEHLSSELLTPYEFIFLSLLLLFISASLFRQISAGRLNIPLLLLPMLIFMFLRIMPVFFSPVLNPHAALSKIAGLLIGVLFFLSLYQTGFVEYDRLRILLIIFVSGIVQSLIGISQFFLSCVDISPLLIKFKGIPYGSFQQLNLMASWLASCIVISLYLILIGLIDSFGRKSKLFFIVLTGLPCFALPLTGSLTGFLGLIAGIALIFFSSKDLLRQKSRLVQVWVVVLLFSFTLGIASSYIFKGDSVLVSKTSKLGGRGLDARIVMYDVGIQMFRTAPLGHGIGDFSSIYPVYETRKFRYDLNSEKRMYGSRHPHNEVLYQLVESGIPGIVGLFFVSGCFLFYLCRCRRKMAVMFLGLLTPLLIHSMFEYPFYQSLPHYALFIVLLYLPLPELQSSWIFVKSEFIKTGLRILITVSAVVSVILVAHTLNGYLKMIQHVKQKARAGVVDLTLLENGLHNPYLINEAERLRMSVMLDYGERNGIRQVLELVESWSSAEAMRSNSLYAYEMNIRSLIALERFEDAFRVAERAVAIYPFLAGRLRDINILKYK